MFPEYTLAPEVQFPVQHEQCYESLKWLTENGETLGLQGTNFTLAGDSAGGESSGRNHRFQMAELHANLAQATWQPA